MEENVMKGKALRNTKGTKTVQIRNPTCDGHATLLALITAGTILGAGLLLGVMVAPLSAQTYPIKPIRLIVPFPPGGPTDVLGRILGLKLGERLGQPVVCENRPGATGNVGIAFAAKARPDGHTIVIGSATMTTSPSLFKKLDYDLVKDLAPISRLGQIPNLVLVHPSLPIKSLKELVEYAKANPEKLNFGSSGAGGPPHLASELLKSLTKINFLHVPYKGASPAVMGVMTGEVNMTITSTPTAMSAIQAGKVRPLAVLSSKRLTSLPDVPTSREAGIDNYEVSSWYGLLAPAETPRDIINRLSAEWIKIAAMPDTLEMMQNAGFETLSSTPEQFSEFIKAEIVRWAKVIKEANIPRMD